VWPKFAIWLLGDEKDGVIKYVETDKQKKIIIDIVELYKRVIAGESIESLKKEFAIAAADAATAYATTAAYATTDAYDDAYATASAAITTAAASAAYAITTAANAAYDDAYATTAAYATTDAYDDAYAAASAARKNHYSKCADKLLEILATS
jgi:hypothetical protein